MIKLKLENMKFLFSFFFYENSNINHEMNKYPLVLLDDDVEDEKCEEEAPEEFSKSLAADDR